MKYFFRNSFKCKINEFITTLLDRIDLTKVIKVLHVFNTAAVPQTIVKYLTKLNVKADVLSRQIYDEKSQMSQLYPDLQLISGSAKKFKLYTLLKCRKYNIIHVHVADDLVLLIKKFYPRKKIVLTYHGTDIREAWANKKKYWKHADFITVSTKDLLDGAPPTVQHTPNPIDMDHFIRKNNFIPSSALYINITRFSKNLQKPLEIAKEEAKKRNLSLTVWEREKWGFLPYHLFPRFLELFEYYIDARVSHLGKLIPEASLTALNALALGLKVILMNKEMDKLPEENLPEKVIQVWIKIYKSLLDISQ